MIAGCTDKGAQPSFCECIAEQILDASGHDATRLRQMEAEVRPGGAPPTVLLQAAQACGKPA
jgi:hypothetical protein